MGSFFKAAICGLCVLLFASGTALAQGERGAITGVVRDPSGAYVPNVTITATDVATNIQSTAQTTDAGVYRISSVQPGTYKVSASVSGFKTGIVDNVLVGVAQTATVDFDLQVGDVGESVTVTSESLLETSTSEVGRYVSANEFQTWPIPVSDGLRQLQSFIFRSLPGAVGNEFQGSINGGQFYSHEILVEGISLGRYDLTGGSMNEFTPSADATNEFRLQAGTLSAQYGNTQTSMANFGMKSGTNDFHGSVYHYLQNEALNANGSLDKFAGRRRQPFKLNNYGATFGGPVWIPKVYKGTDKTFFFVFYEGTDQRNFRSTAFTTLPTVAMKQGDFSALLNPAFTGDPRSGTQIGTDALGRPVIYGQIYDPRTTRRVGNSIVRDPFPGNIIPQAQFSPVTANILRLAPIPDPVNSNFLRNYPNLGTASPFFELDNIGVKVNHAFNEKHKFSTFYNWNTRPRFNSPGGRFGPAPGTPTGVFQFQEVGGRMVRISEDWTISSTKLNHFAFGFNRFINPNNSVYVDQDWPSQIGLQGVAPTHFPRLRFRGTAGIMGGNIGANGQLGSSTASFTASESFIFVDDFTYVRGEHTFRFGTEIRRYRYNARGRSNTSGTFEFRSQQTELPGFANRTGFAFASFLLGAVRNADRSVVTTTPGYRVWYPGFYIQDDWRLNSKLTFNLGLRWDIPAPKKEAFNRLSGLDPTRPNPGADNRPGALVFLQDIGRDSFMDTYWKQFGPRVGFAYNPTANLVIRGGYGLSYTPPINNGFDTESIIGFNGNISLPPGTAATGFIVDPVIYWHNPFPAFQGSLPNKNPALANGGFIDFTDRRATRQPYVQNWNLGIQYQLPWQTVMEVSYVANKGTRLLNPFGATLNQNDPSVLSLGDVLTQPLTNQVPKPYPSFQGSVAQALRPFPQYQDVINNYPLTGFSTYNSLQATVTRRLREGLSLLLGYTYSKALSNTDSAIGDGEAGIHQNVYDLKSDKSVTAFHIPHNLKVTWIYALPFGQGRRFLNRGGIVDAILGGWTVTGIQNYRSGDALAVFTNIDTSTSLFSGGIRPDVVAGVPMIIDRGGVDFANGTPYLNPAAFARPPVTAGGVPLRLGNAPRVLPNVRGPVRVSEDLGLEKQFKFTENANIEIRADFFNVFNRAGRANPDTNVDSPTFGRILGPAYGPRTIQTMIRLNF